MCIALMLNFGYSRMLEKRLALSPSEIKEISPGERALLFDKATQAREHLSTEITVVCGSAGKTKLTEFMGAILRVGGIADWHISLDNQNTKTALASQILHLDPNCQRAVLE